MNESTDAFAAASEVTGKAMEALFNYVPGGSYSFRIRCDRAVVQDLGVIAVSLYSIYKLTPVLKQTIEGVVNRCLEHPRRDQDILGISPGSLHVKLRCLTDKRFLEVWTDYESGKMKERLQEEFSKSVVEVEGLKIEIENLEEVNETKRAIESRSELPSKHTLEMKDEGDIKHESEDGMKDFGDIRASQHEIEVELYRVKAGQMKMEKKQDVTRQEMNEIMRQHDQMERSPMACRIENDEQGYDARHFEGRVREDLFCSICQGVLRNPRTCQNKEHPFCLSCISQYLRNSHACPECREHLTPETLKDPPRFLKNTLSELKIKCDYNERGCPGYVQLGNLQKHVERCGFAPVMCGNEGCGTVINKRDKEIHERELCQFRIPKCHDCKDIKASQDEMKVQIVKMERNVTECQADIKVKVDEMEIKQDDIKESQAEIKVKIDEMQIKQDDIKESQSEMKVQNDEIERKQDEMKKNNDEIKHSQAQMKVDLKEMKDKITGMERKQDQTKQSVDEMKEQFEKMMIMVQQALQGSNVNNNGAQAIYPAVPDNNQDIIILGGYYAPGIESVSKTVEKYSIVEGKSTQLPGMNLPRAGSASCVYNGDVIVAGGWHGQTGTDLIEILKMNQHPLRWTMFDGKLPAKLSAHHVTVYRDKLYIIGGDNWSENKTSDAIYELSLAPPYTVKLLARMPQPRANHRAEIVNGKLFILGGTTTGFSKDATDSVVVYDFIKNEIKPCPSLPEPVWLMSTVALGNTIIVVGGLDKNDQVLNDVIMYHIETGRSERLPSLKHKRRGPSAVIMHDVIVVLGGQNNEEGLLNSVESFTMGDDQWKELPGMKEKRLRATAVVKPRN